MRRSRVDNQNSDISQNNLAARHIPRKRFGQNFLRDQSVIQRIVQAVAPTISQSIVEIGPGEGVLTFALLEHLNELTVVEIDRDLVARLQKYQAPNKHLRVVECDALQVNFAQLAAGKTIRIIGNLPYNISTPLLFHVLSFSEHIFDMHFMLQREVVDRMAAAPGGKVYGRLSVMLQAYCRVEPLFHVPATAFWPIPKVESSVVRLTPGDTQSLLPQDHKTFEWVVRSAFAQRRKTIRNALSLVADERLLSACGVDPNCRAETLSVKQYIDLANKVAESVSNEMDLPRSFEK